MTPSRRHLLTGSVAVAATGWSYAAHAAPIHALCDPAASDEARKLYAYLWSLYGKQTLTGQQEQNFTRNDGKLELNYLEKTTGKLPALVGFDYIDPADNQAVNRRAITWAREGGLVSICWHWGSPTIGTGYENSKKDFDLPAALTPGTVENKAMLRDIDEVARLLAELRDAGVPVLWRPFHEFSGDWFWWGKHGPEAFKSVWALMYERFSRVHRLNNLIWVLGWAGQDIEASWYPGRAMVDIAGVDTYAKDHGPLSGLFGKVKAVVGDSVPICLHENGPVPDPDLLGPHADWLWFMTWHTRWVTDPKQNPPELLKRFFASSRYITRDELPKSMVGMAS